MKNLGELIIMKKQTTTKQLNTAITNKLLHITKSEICSKSTHQANIISPDKFKESLEFINETLFANCVGWHYERNNQTGQYIAEAGRMDGDVDIIVTAYMSVGDDVSREHIDSALMMIEE